MRDVVVGHQIVDREAPMAGSYHVESQETLTTAGSSVAAAVDGGTADAAMQVEDELESDLWEWAAHQPAASQSIPGAEVANPRN